MPFYLQMIISSGLYQYWFKAEPQEQFDKCKATNIMLQELKQIVKILIIEYRPWETG